MILADRMAADLVARGVFAGQPAERASVVAAVAARISDAEWSLVVAYADSWGSRTKAAGMLFAALQSPEGWADVLLCAQRQDTATTAGQSQIPSHYNAGPPPAGRCAHGKLGSEPCAECSALDSIQRPQATPGSRRKRRPDPQSLARANRNSEAHRALYGDSGEDA